MDLSRSKDKLTQDMDRMGDVWTGDPKIDKTPNEVTVGTVTPKRGGG